MFYQKELMKMGIIIKYGDFVSRHVLLVGNMVLMKIKDV